MFKQIILLTSKTKKSPFTFTVPNCNASFVNFHSSSAMIEKKILTNKLEVITPKSMLKTDHTKSNLTKDVDQLEVNDEKKLEESVVSSLVINRLLDLVKSFRERTRTIKLKIAEPLPDRSRESGSIFSIENDWSYQNDEKNKLKKCNDFKTKIKNKKLGVFDSQSYLYTFWLFLVTLAFIYNSWMIFLTFSFPIITSNNLIYFLAADYVCDALYLLDILIFKLRVEYFVDGEVVKNPKKTSIHYIKSGTFKLDCASLIPLDFIFFKSRSRSLFRLFRLLKIQTFWEFFHLLDASIKRPYIIRIIRTLIYMIFMIHLNACAYYFISCVEGFGSNKWVYDGKDNAYLVCFHFAIRTATSISGKMPRPTNSFEYIFMTFSWLLGIFVFAFLIGQIRDIVATANQSKAQYRYLMDSLINFMNNLNLSEELQTRVRNWLNHAWDQKQIFYESKILNYLPFKIKTDIALDVHYDILRKIELFRKCESNMIKDVVIKLRPMLILPGDYIFRKGDLAHEMYIVNDGRLQVLGGVNSDTVINYLEKGSIFGEISILGIPGYYRRTADVKSIGFSNLFALRKTDLWDTLPNYPESQKIIFRKVKQLIKDKSIFQNRHPFNKNMFDVNPIIKPRPNTPELFKTTMKLINNLPKDKPVISSEGTSNSVVNDNQFKSPSVSTSFKKINADFDAAINGHRLSFSNNSIQDIINLN